MVAAEAYVWRSNKPALVKASRIAAAHNAAFAARCAQLAEGDITWVMMAGFCLMPFVAQSAAVLSGDEALARLNPEASRARLAGLHQAEMDAAMELMKQQLAEASAAVLADDTDDDPEAAA